MGEEQRQFPRVSQSFDARYRLYGELTESWRTIRTLNISAIGMRFRSANLIEEGAVLEVEMVLPCLREPLVMRGRVVWSRTMASGVTENGAEFLDMTQEQGKQIDDLVKFLMKDASPPRAS